MSDNQIHEFFKRKSAKWNISDFLDESNDEQFKKKIDAYIKSLENIGINGVAGNLLVSLPFKTFRRATKPMLGHRRTSRFLSDVQDFSSTHIGPIEASGELLDTRPDRQEARTWRKKHKERKSTGEPSVHLHHTEIGTINGDTGDISTIEEWKEITTSEVKDKPKLEHSLVELLKIYTVDNVERLQEILFESFVPDGGKYDRNIYYDLNFINYAYRGMLFLWERKENPFIERLEGWYEMNVWSHLIDPAFHNLNIDLVRGEGMSLASSDRKNLERTIHARKKIGRKGDGVFRLCMDRLEFGAIESGRKWEGQSGTKYMTDSLKICKMLKDMLNQLATECDTRENLVRKLQVVGMLHGANRIQVITVDLPKGYVTRIQHRKVREVAGRLTKSKPLALVLKEILYAKSIITQTLDIINNKDDVDLENFLDDSDEQDGYHTSRTIAVSKTFMKTGRTKDVVNEKKRQ
ncbi:11296_t:CDS:2, partial [Ambispora gerdemannii]